MTNTITQQARQNVNKRTPNAVRALLGTEARRALVAMEALSILAGQDEDINDARVRALLVDAWAEIVELEV